MNQISDAELARYQKLEAVVKRILAQRVDDVCWRDIYMDLAALVGIKYVPQLICSSEQFLANCKRFDESFRSGPYVPVFVEVNQKEPL